MVELNRGLGVRRGAADVPYHDIGHEGLQGVSALGLGFGLGFGLGSQLQEVWIWATRAWTVSGSCPTLGGKSQRLSITIAIVLECITLSVLAGGPFVTDTTPPHELRCTRARNRWRNLATA